MKKSLFLFIVFWTCMGFAQHEINSYRYLIVPEKFSFLKQKDQYNLNSLVKIHFEKLGFTVFFDSETLPDSLVNYNCNKLFADIESTGNFLTTKLVITLKDCKNKLVVQSKEGRSKEKDFKITIKQEQTTVEPQYIMTAPAAMPVAAPAMAAPAPAAPAAAAPSPAPAAASANQITVKSPMIGTFYRSAGPDKAPFVNVGDEIKAGQVVCIIEAMKLFNEIESEVSGRIVKVLVDDASPVEYDQALFIVEPA